MLKENFVRIFWINFKFFVFVSSTWDQKFGIEVQGQVKVVLNFSLINVAHMDLVANFSFEGNYYNESWLDLPIFKVLFY